MKDFTSKIVHSLNEGVQTEVISEPEVGVNSPKQVHQCDNCAEFYVTDEVKSESVCPTCGGEGHPYGDVVECDMKESDDEINRDADPAKIGSPRLDEGDEEEVTDEDSVELDAEAKELVDEALKLLDRNDYRRFNECYRPRSRMTSKGELEMIVESHGHVGTARRRMTSRQKSAYKLSEKYTPVVSGSKTSKKNEAIKLQRQILMMKNESRAIKIQACRLLERQGVKYNFSKFNEGMNKFLESRKLDEAIKRIYEDDEIGTDDINKMNPDEIGDQVTDVIEDTGLEIVSNDVDIDGDTTTVNVRVQDSDDVEVHTSEIQDVLSDVFDAPVEIAGPYEAEGDKSISDLAIIINPDADLNEDDDLEIEDEEKEKEIIDEDDDDLDLDDESNDAPETDAEEDELEDEDPEDKFESIRRRKIRRRNESLKKSLSRRKNEMFVEGTGNTPLFALVTNNTAGNKNNNPMFLAQDDSLISGNQPNAEDVARLFVSYEAALKYIQDAGIEDKYQPVAITIVTNKIESIDDDDFHCSKSVNEEGDDEDDEESEVFAHDGEDLDESEDDNSLMDDELDKIKESYRTHRSSRRKLTEATHKCPKCGSTDIEGIRGGEMQCNKCAHTWKPRKPKNSGGYNPYNTPGLR